MASNARTIDATSIEACFRSSFSVIFTFNAALNESANRERRHHTPADLKSGPARAGRFPANRSAKPAVSRGFA
jgi:hypothetical protein